MVRAIMSTGFFMIAAICLAFGYVLDRQVGTTFLDNIQEQRHKLES